MRVAFISGVHEDIVSLERFFSKIDELGIDQVVCLGDIVGYTVPYFGYFRERDSNDCVNLIRDNCSSIVLGNHDLYAIKRVPQTPIFNEVPIDWYNLNYQKRRRLSNEKLWLYEEDELSSLLNNKNINYLSSLPVEDILIVDGTRILISHYIYPDITGDSKSISYENKDDRLKYFSYMKEKNCTIGVFAHDLISGIGIITEEGYETKDFNKDCMIEENGLSAYHGSWVARGTENNGFLVFDSSKMIMIAYKLSNYVHEVPECYLDN